MKQEPDLNEALDSVASVGADGELSYVPIFLGKYLSNQGATMRSICSITCATLVGDAMHAIDPEDFEDQVPELYGQLLDKFGSDKALVLRGERHVVSSQPHAGGEGAFFRSSHRRSFEAATGIDCTSWYQDGKLRPLAAMATLEGFLESPEAEQYKEGIRYFWGHPIPDRVS